MKRWTSYERTMEPILVRFCAQVETYTRLGGIQWVAESRSRRRISPHGVTGRLSSLTLQGPENWLRRKDEGSFRFDHHSALLVQMITF